MSGNDSTPARAVETALTIAARAAQAVVFVGGGRAVWANPQGPAVGAAPFLATLRKYVPALTRVSDENLVKLNAGAMFVGGVAVGTGAAPKLGAALLVGSLVPTTLAAFPFWEKPEGPERMHTQSDFLKNLAIAGGLLATVAYAGRVGRRF